MANKTELFLFESALYSGPWVMFSFKFGAEQGKSEAASWFSDSERAGPRHVL